MTVSWKNFPIMKVARDLLKLKVRSRRVALVTMLLPHQVGSETSRWYGEANCNLDPQLLFRGTLRRVLPRRASFEQFDCGISIEPIHFIQEQSRRETSGATGRSFGRDDATNTPRLRAFNLDIHPSGSTIPKHPGV